jgi:hypothetical protein
VDILKELIKSSLSRTVEQSADPAKAAQKETEKPQAPNPPTQTKPQAAQPEKKQEKGGVEGWVSKQLDWYEKSRDDVNQILVDKVKGIPVLEQAAQSYKWFDNQQAQLSSGFVKGGAALVVGVVTMVSNPVQTAKGLFAMAEHVPMMNGLMPNPMKLVHGLYDITVNKEDAKTVAYRVFDTKQSMQEDAQFWKTVGSAFIAPYKESIDKGRYSEAAGRGIFDIGSLFIGAGEANAAVKGGSVAGKVAETANVAGRIERVAGVTNAIGKTEKVTEAVSLSDKAADIGKGTKATEVAGSAAKTADVSDVSKVEKTTETIDKVKQPASIKESEIPNAATKTDKGIEAAEPTGAIKDQPKQVEPKKVDEGPVDIAEKINSKKGYKSTPEVRQAFKEFFGETRYAEYAQEMERLKVQRPELRNIPTEDLVAVRGYTSSDYRMINKALRSGNPEELARLDAYIKTAESGLNQLPSHEGQVFRGTNLKPEVAVSYSPGEIVTERAFLSSSVSKNSAFAGNTEFIIESSNGKRISFLSEFPKEEEVLFSPGTRFKVLLVDENPITGVRKVIMDELREGGK